ncbi:MAG: peptidoglycan DD-metalloendopeptidase family protein [bacterium]|nr:peptidoglycan DD-metalloendopeptidase family protein [bacterium]
MLTPYKAHLRFCLFTLLVLICFTLAPLAALDAQTDAPCGVVDAIGYPVENLMETTIRPGFDDFSLYRARFSGNHVGIDIAFNQQGAPVRAVARGRVTLSDVEEWDTEKGVVILEHVFPDGSRYFSLYGHMEVTNEISFPEVGQCVEMGDTVGAVGWPSRGAPHLHYEIRNFLPDDGGPGYVTGNPLLEGWYHPLDFTHLWQIRLTPAFNSAVTFEAIPTVPPVILESGTVVVASDNVVAGVNPAGLVLWRITTDGRVIGLRGMSGERVVAHTTNSQVVMLTDGSYTALWNFRGAEEEAFVAAGETLLFTAPDGGLAAFSPEGQIQWTLPAPANAQVNGSGFRVLEFATNPDPLHGTTIAQMLRVENQVVLRVVNPAGDTLFDALVGTNAVIAPAMSGGWMLLADNRLQHILPTGDALTLGEVNAAPGRTARLASDVTNNIYLFMGDAENTLLSWDHQGGVRWRVRYPAVSEGLLPPLMKSDLGCLLYILDADGRLNVFNAATGDMLTQVELYAGGTQNRRPAARLLDLLPDGRVRVNAGFLSTITLNSAALGGEALNSCLLG